MAYNDLAQSLTGRLDRKAGSLISKALPRDGNRVWKVTTKPYIEPVSLDELKSFARIDGDDEDALIEGFIQAARGATEGYLGRALIQQTIRMLMDFWPGNVVELPMPPLISVTKVATLGEDDSETEYSSDNYYVVTEGTPGKIVLKQSVTAPINTERDIGGYLVEYKAGYGTDGPDVPASIREGVKLWAATVYAMRTIDPKNPPPEARVMLDSFRTVSVRVR